MQVYGFIPPKNNNKWIITEQTAILHSNAEKGNKDLSTVYASCYYHDYDCSLSISTNENSVSSVLQMTTVKKSKTTRPK